MCSSICLMPTLWPAKTITLPSKASDVPERVDLLPNTNEHRNLGAIGRFCFEIQEFITWHRKIRTQWRC